MPKNKIRGLIDQKTQKLGINNAKKPVVLWCNLSVFVFVFDFERFTF